MNVSEVSPNQKMNELFVILRNSIDVQSDIGKSKAMCLFKELMMMIESHELNMQQVEFDLDKTLDIKKARDTLKVTVMPA